MTSDLSDSLWFHSSAETVDAPVLTQDVTADLVVIGGGYTGLSAALRAAQDGARVVLIEAREFGHGGSGRNVGLVNAGLWLAPDKITSRLGHTVGTRLSRLLAGAPDLVFDLIARHTIACEPVRNGTLHCAHAPRGMASLTSRHAQLVAQGAPVQLLTRDKAVEQVGSDQVYGALLDPRAGTIQPLAYALGLARAAQQAGATLYQNSPATRVAHAANRWQVDTPQGRIQADAMIMATNGYALDIQGLETPRCAPVHFFQAATDPLPPEILTQILPGKQGCWDTALIMSSWRLDQAGRLIIGGMGDLGHPGATIHRHWLKRKLARMFPALAGTHLRQTWCGRIAMTAEYMPKLLAPHPRSLVCFGFSGRGIGPGTLFGTHMAKALLSDDISTLPLPPVATHALPFSGLRRGYYETGAALTHLAKDRL